MYEAVGGRKSMTINNIRYLYNSKTGIELIYCVNSTISYPLHNHISVLTIGIVLDGSIVLTANNEEKTYEKNQTFVIFPYMPHSISAHSSYTLLSLCIDKNAVTQYATDIIQNNVVTLLMETLSAEKINQYQILQLLNRLNSLVDYSDWYSDNQNPFINDLKRQLELYPESKLSIEDFIKQFEKQVGLPPLTYKMSSDTI